jgi:hypothetical protein
MCPDNWKLLGLKRVFAFDITGRGNKPYIYRTREEHVSYSKSYIYRTREEHVSYNTAYMIDCILFLNIWTWIYEL